MRSRLGIAASATLGTLVIALCGGALVAGAVFIVEHLVIRMFIGFGLIPTWVTDDHPWALTAAAVVFVIVMAPLLYAVARRAFAVERSLDDDSLEAVDGDGDDGDDAGRGNGDDMRGGMGAGPTPAASPF